MNIHDTLGVNASFGGAYVFALYWRNLATCLREKIFAVPGTLKALSQIWNLQKNQPLLLYCIDRHRLYHGSWTAAGWPFTNTEPLPFEGGLYRFNPANRGKGERWKPILEDDLTLVEALVPDGDVLLVTDFDGMVRKLDRKSLERGSRWDQLP